MATLTKRRACIRYPCPEYATVGNLCDEHARERDRARGSTADRGYDSAWQSLRSAYAAQHPLCEYCLERGRARATEHVDHVIPISVRPDLRLEWTNLRASCAACNVAKANRGRANPSDHDRT